MDTSTAQKVLSALIQKQMVILGPSVALGRARKVKSLTVADDGNVTGISGDADTSIKQLVDEYVALSGEISRNIFNSLVSNL